ncbi:hypothetical protein [Promicromonospora soli]|nr:hypothetical protein [Promicromonospora soli]
MVSLGSKGLRVEPGHDAWVLGDEPCITVDFGASPTCAAKSS